MVAGTVGIAAAIAVVIAVQVRQESSGDFGAVDLRYIDSAWSRGQLSRCILSCRRRAAPGSRIIAVVAVRESATALLFALLTAAMRNASSASPPLPLQGLERDALCPQPPTFKVQVLCRP